MTYETGILAFARLTSDLQGRGFMTLPGRDAAERGDIVTDKAFYPVFDDEDRLCIEIIMPLSEFSSVVTDTALGDYNFTYNRDDPESVRLLVTL